MENLLSTKAEVFKKLHEQAGIFVVPNPWDAGSAKILELMGFKALATSSAGLAFSIGKSDGHASITREETLQNARSIAEATRIPVSADLENGYGMEPGTCAETIRLAAAAGVAGGSIEDATGNPADPIYPFELALERIKAAVQAARSCSYPFMLTARAENLLYGKMDLVDTIRRLVAFADAGADVLFAPGLKTADEIKAVVNAVAPKPVNVIMGLAGMKTGLQELQDLGVKRVSVGSSLMRAAYGAFFRAAEEIRDNGSFAYADGAKSYGELNELFGQRIR